MVEGCEATNGASREERRRHGLTQHYTTCDYEVRRVSVIRNRIQAVHTGNGLYYANIAQDVRMSDLDLLI